MGKEPDIESCACNHNTQETEAIASLGQSGPHSKQANGGHRPILSQKKRPNDLKTHFSKEGKKMSSKHVKRYSASRMMQSKTMIYHFILTRVTKATKTDNQSVKYFSQKASSSFPISCDPWKYYWRDCACRQSTGNPERGKQILPKNKEML